MKAGSSNSRDGFTLIELILVLVILVTVASISASYFSGTLRGMKLRTGGRTVIRMAQHARGLAIMREKTIGMAINEETMEIYIGGLTGGSSGTLSTNASDGEIDQDILERLDYVDGEGETPTETGDVEQEIKRKLPEGLVLAEFNKDIVADEEDLLENIHVVRFFSNGQCEWFEMELEDVRGMGIKLEIDPISGKVDSELTQ